LKEHYLQHHPRKPFGCPKCPRRLRTDEKLKQHILNHLVEDDFICPYCSKKLSDKNALNKHLSLQKCDFLKELRQ